MFYKIHNVYQRTPFHIMNAAEVYGKCKSRELIISFNKSGLCVGYNTMKTYCSDIAKYAVVSGQEKKKKCGTSESFSPIDFYSSSF